MEIIALIFGAVILVSGVFFFGSMYFSKGTPIAKYDGEFKRILLEGMLYLRLNHELPFTITVFEGDDEKIDTVKYLSFRKPQIELNVGHLRNQGWLRDFNRVADAWGFQHLDNMYDTALFLLFHEYRHMMQLKYKDLQWHVLPDTEINKKSISDYRLQPKESDSDWFALTQLGKLRGRITE